MSESPPSKSDKIDAITIQGPGALHPTAAVVMRGQIERDIVRASLQRDFEAATSGLPPAEGMADPVVEELADRTLPSSSASVHLAGDKRYAEGYEAIFGKKTKGDESERN